MILDSLTTASQTSNYQSIAPRSSSIDLLRTIAASAVIVIHISGDLQVEGACGSYTWWVGNIADSILRWCVPIFVMISGMLLLDPFKKETPSKFYSKRMKRIFIPLVFWSAFYLVYQMIHSKDFTIHQAIKLIIQGRPYNHLWYLYMTMGLYAFTPVFRLTINGMSKRLFLALTVLLLSMSALEEFISKFYFGIIAMASGMVMFLPYIGYFFVGAYIRKSGTSRFNFLSLGVVFCTCALVIIFGTYLFAVFSVEQNKYYFYSFTNPFVMIMSISLFIFIQKLSDLNTPWLAKIEPVIKKVAPATFGVYLVHPFVIDIIAKLRIEFPYFYPRDPIADLFLISLLVFCFSLQCTLIIQRLPRFKSIVG
jgi:surface polysaccharide O-acyltransferase-like enzyme